VGERRWEEGEGGDLLKEIELMKEHHASYWYAFIIGGIYINFFSEEEFILLCVSGGYLYVGWLPYYELVGYQWSLLFFLFFYF
jgi:hypothetical protein